ncbi:hypothetical protein [Streptomyces violaceus]|uniref:Uncharacterized protein n=1 Tax=Streptomyces violaceus TaxID=1936 RepID=A0ABZ1NLK9_STRVL
MTRISALFRERLRTAHYSVTYQCGPRFECVKHRGRKAEWFMDGVPVSENFAKTWMQNLDTERRG